MLRVTVFLVTVCGMLLSSCSNMKSADAADEKQKVKTAKVNVQLGIAYLERNDVNRAKKKLLLAMQQAPNIPETWYSMAYFLESTGNKEQAKKYYMKALSLNPERGDVQNNYGTFLCRSGAHEESIQHFMLAVKDPDYLDTADAYENAGLCALKIPNKRLAYNYFNMAISQNPSRPVSLVKVAQMDYANGDYQNAKIKLDQYLAIAPATPQTNSLMADIKKQSMPTQPYRENDEEPRSRGEHSNHTTYKSYLKSVMLERVSNDESEIYYKEPTVTHKKVHAAAKTPVRVQRVSAAKPPIKSKSHKPVNVAQVKIKHMHSKAVTVSANVKTIKKQSNIIARPKHPEKAYSWSV